MQFFIKILEKSEKIKHVKAKLRSSMVQIVEVLHLFSSSDCKVREISEPVPREKGFFGTGTPGTGTGIGKKIIFIFL
jgi:hypothetical protein